MKRRVVPIAVAVLLLFATPLFADMEFGLSFTPVGGIDTASGSQSMLDDSIKGFHFGYIFWKVFYLSWDALVMPPSSVQSLTTSIEQDPVSLNYYTREGYYRPGFLNLFDAGLRFVLGPVVLFTGAGVNQLRVYKQDELPDLSQDFGANLRAGAGLKFKWWGVSLSATKAFASFDGIVNLAQNLAGPNDYQRQLAADALTSNLVPSIMLVIYLQ